MTPPGSAHLSHPRHARSRCRSSERAELILAVFLDFGHRPTQCVRYSCDRMSVRRSGEHTMRARTDSAVHPVRDVTMTRRRDDALTAAPFPPSSLSRRAFLAGSAGGAALALSGWAP